MKKIMLLCAAMVALLVSCSKDNNDMKEDEDKIIGTWEFASYVYRWTLNGTTSESSQQIDNNPATYIIFHKGGSLSGNINDVTVSGFTSHIEVDYEYGVVYPGQTYLWTHYDVEDNKLTLYDNENAWDDYSIITLNSSELIIQSSPRPYTSNGHIQYTYYLKKQ